VVPAAQPKLFCSLQGGSEASKCICDMDGGRLRLQSCTRRAPPPPLAGPPGAAAAAPSLQPCFLPNELLACLQASRGRCARVLGQGFTIPWGH
jgi:hypothetical protein